MSFENLLLDRDGPVVVITINRPSVLNALNAQTLDELGRAVLEIEHDANIRVVIVTGAGDKAFVAGADINELRSKRPADARDYALLGQDVFQRFERLGKPVIAAVNGFALGGGCELAMACTLRIASETARFGQPEINLGLIPGFAGSQRLSRLIGKGRALELMLTGRVITAQEALQLGLVNKVVPESAVMDEAKGLATALAGKAPIAMRCIIEAVNHGLDMPLADASSFEASLFGVVAATDDAREGTAAFLEKRKPTFQGR